VNERVAEVNRQFAGGVAAAGKASELIEIFCECGQQDRCDERVNDRCNL